MNKSRIELYYRITVIVGILVMVLGFGVIASPNILPFFTQSSAEEENLDQLADLIHQQVADDSSSQQIQKVDQPYETGILSDAERALMPKNNVLIIDSVGINVDLLEGQDYKDLLLKGAWVVPDYARPDDPSKVTIIAAHRYGNTNTNRDWKLKHSFTLLPEVKDGETVVIFWNSKKYTYKIVNTTVGERIQEHSSNLVLYTCEGYNNPIRIFKYLNLVKIEQ